MSEDKKFRTVKTYEYVMESASDRLFPDYLAARELPDGSSGVDILDRLKIRGKVKLPLGITISLKFGELFKCKDMGYIDGPIRVLLDVEGYMEFFGFLKIKGMTTIKIAWYPNHLMCRIQMDIPLINTGTYQLEDLHGYLDLNSNMYGATIFSPNNPYNKEVILDGQMSEAEKKLDVDSTIDWIVTIGPKGALFARMFWIPRPDDLVQSLYYKDDAQFKEPPETHPGVSSVGYTMNNFIEKTKEKRLPPAVEIYFYAKKSLNPDEVYGVLNIIDHPVMVTVTTK